MSMYSTFGLKTAVTSMPGPVLKSPFSWKRYGDSGRRVSEVFPEMAKRVDDMAFLMAMKSTTNVHGPASYMQNTGFTLPGFPCMGAWISYAIGTLSDHLPAFVVLPDPRGLPYNNAGNFSAGFLPAQHQGTRIHTGTPVPIAHLRPPDFARHITERSEAEGRDLLTWLNREHLRRNPGDSRLEARIRSFELAAKMQLSAPRVLDVSGETASTRKSFGLDDDITRPFGLNCLIARRLLERGVRFVQVSRAARAGTG